MTPNLKIDDSIIKYTSTRAYIETEDFFKDPAIIETIKSLASSSIVRDIDRRNQAGKEDEGPEKCN